MSLKLNLLLAFAASGLPVAAVAQQETNQMQPATPPTTEQPPADTASQQSNTTADAAASLKPVTAADVKVGASVYDTKGDTVGKIDKVEGKSAVVSTGTVKASIPLTSFGMGDKGLVIAMTKAQLESEAKAKAKPETKAEKPPK